MKSKSKGKGKSKSKFQTASKTLPTLAKSGSGPNYNEELSRGSKIGKDKYFTLVLIYLCSNT